MLMTVVQGPERYADLYLVSLFTQNYLLHIFWCLYLQRVVICEQRPMGNSWI